MNRVAPFQPPEWQFIMLISQAFRSRFATGERRAARVDPTPHPQEAPVARPPRDRGEAPFYLITTFTIIN